MSGNLFTPEQVCISTFHSKPLPQWAWKAENGIRIVYLPDGKVFECDTERSQHANRAKCEKALNQYISSKGSGL